jgi:DNA-binding transcriptional ArsR family regulator
MGVPPSSLQRELRDLAEAGILKTHRQGRMSYYPDRRADITTPSSPLKRPIPLSRWSRRRSSFRKSSAARA